MCLLELHYLLEHWSHLFFFEDTYWLTYCNCRYIQHTEQIECVSTMQGHQHSWHGRWGVWFLEKKVELWKRACVEGDFTWFPQLHDWHSSEVVGRDPVKSVIEPHLTKKPFVPFEANRSKHPASLCHQTLAYKWNLSHPFSHSFGSVCEERAP